MHTDGRNTYVRIAPQRYIHRPHLAQLRILPILDPAHAHWMIRRPYRRLHRLCRVDRGGDEREVGPDKDHIRVEHGVVVFSLIASVFL